MMLACTDGATGKVLKRIHCCRFLVPVPRTLLLRFVCGWHLALRLHALHSSLSMDGSSVDALLASAACGPPRSSLLLLLVGRRPQLRFKAPAGPGLVVFVSDHRTAAGAAVGDDVALLRHPEAEALQVEAVTAPGKLLYVALLELLQAHLFSAQLAGRVLLELGARGARKASTEPNCADKLEQQHGRDQAHDHSHRHGQKVIRDGESLQLAPHCSSSEPVASCNRESGGDPCAAPWRPNPHKAPSLQQQAGAPVRGAGPATALCRNQQQRAKICTARSTTRVLILISNGQPSSQPRSPAQPATKF
eukprot:COSAG06_NODE_7307_length_2551_cov_1.805057_2_plen_304_part_01